MSDALQEYVLICCQHPSGGLIDKPGKLVVACVLCLFTGQLHEY